MLNLMLGPPGGGKSYEAVVYHVLPALQEGRKVITNLSLNIDEISKIEPRARQLIDLRTKSVGTAPRRRSPFGGESEELPLHAFGAVEDYGDTWRHPEKGYGALYVIDECHKALPRAGTPRAVEEWYAEHRHELCDVLLITQSYGKVSKAITDAVQVVYRCKKAVAFGKPAEYVRKVQDGVRGEVMATTFRTYESKYFKLYKSHTKSLAGAMEAAAKDVSPVYLKWKRAGVVFMLVGGIFAVVQGIKLFSPSSIAKQPKAIASARTQEHAQLSPQAADPFAEQERLAEAMHVPEAAAEVEPPPPESATVTPFDGLRLHIAGRVVKAGQAVYLFILSQNGQPVQQLRSAEVEAAGYTVEPISECVARLEYPGGVSFFARCDLPTVAMPL